MDLLSEWVDGGGGGEGVVGQMSMDEFGGRLGKGGGRWRK